MIIKNSNGDRLVGEVTGKGPLVILFHGIFDTRRNTTIQALKDALVRNGYSALTFDVAGHGESEGKASDTTIDRFVSDAELVIRYARKQGLDRDGIILAGRSFGGYPVIAEAIRNKDVRAVILINPATEVLSLMFSKKTENELGKYTKKHTDAPILSKIRFFINAIGYNLYAMAEKITCPVYVLHSEDDEIVPFTQSKTLEKHIRSRKRFVFIKGENHNMDRSRVLEKRILPEIVRWLKTA